MNIRYVSIAIALCLVSSLAACGDDSTADDDDKGKSGRGGSTAQAGNGAGTGGAGGGLFGLTDLTGLLTPMCNPDAESVTSCGGTECPALATGSEGTCTITCCSFDERCGTRSADTRIESALGTTCTAPALPDTRCPDLTLGGLALPGCCTENNACGQIVANLCIAAATPRACDAPPTEDAGI